MGNVTLATRTMVAIHRAMVADQGGSFRQWQQKVLPHLDDAYRGQDDGFRSHLGASVLGDECGRAVWYGFRWATKKDASGQMLRLWNRGHLEEGRFIAMLLMVGVHVVQQDENGKQFRIKFASGHGGGSGDGFGCRIPDLPPETWAQLEFKTHNRASFEKLAGKNFRDWFMYTAGESRTPAQFTGEGVRFSKPDHYFQMQMYMNDFNLTCALYGAVNKDTDDVYMEIVHADRALAGQLKDRAEKIIWLHDAPKMINESVGYYGCRFCDHKPVCKMGVAPHRNCRTCAYSEPIATPEENGAWRCRLHEKLIGKDTQLTGCPNYVLKKM